ncbi:MAG: ABC transporter permease [Gemmatimonadetes bacterium]|nr:ABC transporter permease [Gemmatimonadota bacterium]
MIRRGSGLARLIVRVASLMTPARGRADWIEEWDAELWHEARRPDGRPVRAVMGAFADALASRALAGSAAPDMERKRGWSVEVPAKELQIGMRALRRSPGFALIAVVTLALGLGATAALFAVLDAVVLEPLPYARPDRLITVSHPVPGYSTERNWPLSQAGFFQLRNENRTLENLGVYAMNAVNLADEGAPPERLDAAYITAGMFDVLRISPALGRLFGESDDAPGAPRVVVLSHALWQSRYGGDASVVGRSIRLDGNTLEIVGVTGRGQQLPDVPVDLWLPFQLDPAQPPVNSHYLAAIGRLRDGVTLAEANTDLRALTDRFTELFPQAYSAGFMRQFQFSTEVRPLRDEVLGDIARVLWTLFGAVGLMLVIASANVANLFLVRTEAKRHESSVRAALGASRSALARGFFVESALIALCAAVPGVVLAAAAVRLLVSIAPSSLPRLDAIGLDASVVIFTIMVATLAALGFGGLSFLRFRADSAVAGVLEGGRRTTASRKRHRTRHAMVVGQVALALVLLAGAGLLLRSFQRLTDVDPGFDPEGVVAFDVGLPAARYLRNEQAVAFYDALLERVRAIPGVTAAGATTYLPLGREAGCYAAQFESQPATQDARPPCVRTAFITPGLVESMGTLVDGRTMESIDVQSGAGPALVTRSLADRFWPGEDPIGKGIKPFRDRPPFYRVVGVMEDIRADGLEKPVVDVVYYPMRPIAGEPEAIVRSASITVRTTRPDPLTLLLELRAAMSDIDAEIPIGNVTTMDRVVARSMNRLSFALLLIGISAGVALVLGAVGLYGVIAYVVNQRRAEIGVRMALGAHRSSVGAQVVRQSLALTLAGVAAGLIVAMLLLPVLSRTSLLYDTAAADPLTLAGVSAGLLLVAAAASWVPAWRAATVDPAEALRTD